MVLWACKIMNSLTLSFQSSACIYSVHFLRHHNRLITWSLKGSALLNWWAWLLWEQATQRYICQPINGAGELMLSHCRLITKIAIHRFYNCRYYFLAEKCIFAKLRLIFYTICKCIPKCKLALTALS